MRSRYAGHPFTTSTRGDRGRAGGCQHPDAAAFARAYHRRPAIHPRVQADGHLPQRGAGVHVRGGQGPSPRGGAAGDHRLSRPRLPRARAAEPRTHPGNDGLGGLRARYRRLPAPDLWRRWISTASTRAARPRCRPRARPIFPVLVVGCGESGILAGIRLKQANIPFTIVEKNAGPGGTWWENSYPGARVDVANHFYCYSFEPNNDWTHFFAEQHELQDYFTQVMTKHDLAEHVRWNTEVLAAEWNDDDGMWSVRAARADGQTSTLRARALITAVGQLNRPHIPRIRRRRHLRGPVVPLRGLGSLRRPDAASGSRCRRRRQRLPDRPRHRRPTSSISPCSSGPRSGCSRTRCTTTRSATVCAGRCATCRSTDGGTGSSCCGPAPTRASTPPRATRTMPTRTTPSATSTPPPE